MEIEVVYFAQTITNHKIARKLWTCLLQKEGNVYKLRRYVSVVYYQAM